ncbi:MAG: DUF3520 domain-containing protein [Nocardioidaceae bacterium]|nr:DUF3520 domain-containing protein [Nocardioidaceae bacterium]
MARDAKAQVEFDPAAVSSYRLIGYDNRAISDDEFESDSVDAGEIGAGHEVTALYEVELTQGVEPGDAIGAATVRWESVATGEIDEAVATLTAADPAGDGSEQLALSSTVADLAQFLKGAGPMAERDVDLAQLAARAADLEEAGVEGAAELSGLIQLAQHTDG